MLNLVAVLPQVDGMAEHIAGQAGAGVHVLPTDEIMTILESQSIDNKPKANVKRSRFGDDHMAAMYDEGRLFDGESAV